MLLANSPMINSKYIMPIVCCPKLKLSKSKFKIHPFSLNSFRDILQTSSRLPFQRSNESSQAYPKLEVTLSYQFNLPFSFSAY